MVLQLSTSWHTMSDLKRRAGVDAEASCSQQGGGPSAAAVSCRGSGGSEAAAVSWPGHLSACASEAHGSGRLRQQMHLITSSVTRPPPLRITSASPCFRPCQWGGGGSELQSLFQQPGGGAAEGSKHLRLGAAAPMKMCMNAAQAGSSPESVPAAACAQQNRGAHRDHKTLGAAGGGSARSSASPKRRHR